MLRNCNRWVATAVRNRPLVRMLSSPVGENIDLSTPDHILKELQDISGLAKPSDARKILVLDLNHIRPKRPSSSKKGVVSRSKTAAEVLSLFNLGDEDISFYDALDNIRNLVPQDSISKKTLDQLTHQILDGFKKKQLIAYITKNGASASAHHKKAKLVDTLIEKVWGFKLSTKLVASSLLQQKTVKVSDLDIFLLLLGNAFMIRYLQKTGVRLAVKKQSLEFLGTPGQIQNAELIFSVMMSRSKTEKVDLRRIIELFEEKEGSFSVEKVSNTTDVAFEAAEDGIHLLRSLSDAQIKRAKRLLVWLLDYNLHLRTTSITESLSLTDLVEYIPYSDNDSLPWNLKGRAMFRKCLEGVNREVNNIISGDIERFSDDRMARNITMDDLDIAKGGSREIAARHLLFEESARLEEDLPEAFELFESLGLDTSDILVNTEMTLLKLTEKQQANEDESKFSASELKSLEFEGEAQDNSVLNKNKHIDTLEYKQQSASIFSAETKREMYERLSDFKYIDSLPSGNLEEHSPVVCTTTFGTLLLETQSCDGPQHFCSDVPFVSDKMLEGGVFLNRGEEKNNSAAVQLRFLPSPFVTNAEVLYPPIEVIMDINPSTRKADPTTFAMVAVEAENSVFTSLPGRKVDLKVSSQITSTVMREVGDELIEEQNGNEANYRQMMNEPSEHLSMFKSQPGVQSFLDRAVLDFSLLLNVHIPQELTVLVDGKPVVYQYVNMTFRQTVEETIEGHLMQLNVIEGGELGGRRIEVNMVGDLESGFSEQTVLNLLDATSRVVTAL